MEYNLEITQKNISAIEFIQNVITPIELNRANVTLVKANNYDYYRGITDSSGNIIESPEEYKLRVPKEYRL